MGAGGCSQLAFCLMLCVVCVLLQLTVCLAEAAPVAGGLLAMLCLWGCAGHA